MFVVDFDGSPEKIFLNTQSVQLSLHSDGQSTDDDDGTDEGTDRGRTTGLTDGHRATTATMATTTGRT